MKRILVVLSQVAVSLSATSASAQIPPPPLAPPIAAPLAPGVPQQRLIAWMPGEVMCDGKAATAMPMRRPYTAIAWGSPNLKPITLTFAIDGQGRTIDIRRDAKEYTIGSDDIAPSLAVTSFAAGKPRSECRVSYTPRLTTFADAPIEDLLSYSLNPISGTLPKAGWDRIRPPGTCLDEPRPQPLTMSFPDYRSIPGTPGVKDWTMTVYDISASGAVHDPRVLTGTRNARLDAAALGAIGRSRFTEGPRTACVYPFVRRAETLVAPDAPAEDAFRPADATCPRHVAWAVKPTLTYPAAYQRRSVEGWAMVVYDLAPWGETGNVHVVAQQPSDDFGAQAMQVIRSARAVAQPQGATGCVDRVRFVIAARGAPPPSE